MLEGRYKAVSESLDGRSSNGSNVGRIFNALNYRIAVGKPEFSLLAVVFLHICASVIPQSAHLKSPTA